MARQYRLYYKRGVAPDFGVLQPRVHASIYNKPEVQAAVAHVRDNPHVEGMALRLDDEQFNVIAFNQDAEAPNAFMFEPPGEGPE